MATLQAHVIFSFFALAKFIFLGIESFFFFFRD